jgi:hypothetical protein
MSVYGPVVTVVGRVSDSKQQPGSTLDLKNVTWVIPGSERGGRIEYREDGSFDFSYSTRGIRGYHFLSVRAQSKKNRFFERVIALLESQEYPDLEVALPVDGSTYSEEVQVAGRVTAAGGSAAPESLSWSLSGSDRRGQVAVAEDGSFGFSFPTGGLTGDRTLTLRAENRQGMAAEKSVLLRAPAVAREEKEAPGIFLSTPIDGGTYGAGLVVAGILRPAAVFDSLRFRLSSGGEAGEEGGGELSGEAEFNQVSGVFDFELDTQSLRGTRTLELVAAASGGRQVRTAVRISDGMQSRLGPLIELTVPENNSFYKTTVSVVGRVVNSREETESAAGVASLSWRLLSDPARKGDIEFDPKTGVFSTDFSAAGLKGRQSLEFNAENRQGDSSRTTLTLRDGNLLPVPAIDSPPDSSAYGAWVAVSGTLTGADGEALPAEAIQSLTYLVASAESFDPDKELSGAISLKADGSFRFLFPGRGLAGPQQVSVRAEAFNGNSAEAAVTLAKGESDFPAFRVLPGDRRVTVSWDPLPLTAAYSLVYAEGEREAGPGSLRIDDVGAPVVVEGLKNGRLYTFKLSARAEGETYGSSLYQCIPLSPHTLAPTVRGEYEKIVVSWPAIPGGRVYELWRGVDDPKNLDKLAGGLEATEYEDTEVLYGRTYSYAVRPALPESLMSRTTSAQTLPFPVRKLVASGSNPDVRPLAVAARGAYAFVAAGPQGVSVVDVADPSQPRTVGVLASFDALDVDYDGEYVYLADGEKGLKVIDVSEPSRPQQLGFRKTFAAQGIRVRGDFAYVADGEKGLKVIDIREPRYPVRVASLDTEEARGVALQGDTLYLADGDGGLKVADISDPARPRLIGTFPLEGVRAVTVAGPYAGLAAGDRGLIILDISDPSAPRTLGSFATPEALDVAARGKYMFLADRSEGIVVIDIGDPARPTRFASLKGGGAVGLAVSDEYAYVARDSGLQVVNVRIEGKSRQLAGLETEGKAYGLDLSADYAYVADHQRGLQVIDISRPAAVGPASLTGSCDTDYAEDVVVKDGFAYVSDGPRGLKIIDVRPAWDDNAATQPRVVGSFDSEGNSRGLSLQDEYLFLADGQAGLQVLNVRDPGHPVWVAEDGGPEARDVLVRDGRAFVIGAEGLRVLDVSSPDTPRLLGSFPTGAGFRLSLAGELLCAVASSGLWLLDVSAPAAIVPLSVYAAQSAEDVFIAGGYAYLAEGFDGLTVLDMRDPRNPIRVSTCAEVYAVGVAVRERYAFVVDSSGLKVIEILIPPWLSN